MQHAVDYLFTMTEDNFSILKPGDCPDDEELCVATIADRGAVMAIEPDGYSGFDYLPSTYERFIGGHGTMGFVYKKQGEVVGFFSIVLVDDEQTVATSAGRIYPKWRGGGMYGRFKRRVLQRCLDLNPKLKYTVMTTHNLNWDINGKKLQKAYRVITETDIFVYTVDTADAKTRPLRTQAEIPGIQQAFALSQGKMSILQPGDCPDDEELCVATIADKDAVMGIEPDGYNGHDYLPYTYDKFVSGPGVAGYLYKKQGQVVGFFSTMLVDGGQTLATSAGRIHQQWRGGGMYGRFTRRVFQRSVSLDPSVRYSVLNTTNINWDINGHRLRKSYKVLEEKGIVFLQLDTQALRKHAPKEASQIPGIRQLTREDLHRLMADKPRDVFPGGRLMMHVRSYRIMEENADLIFSAGDSFLGSFAQDASPTKYTALSGSSFNGAGSSPQSVESTDGKDSCNLSLLSCANYTPCRRGITYQVNFSGIGSDEAMRAHLQWHMLQLAEIAGDQDTFLIVIYPNDASKVIERVMKEYPESKIDVALNKVVMLETEFKAEGKD